MASKIFIAVQCFQCSMMQVKQQKKSSNKWTCVVCNQKQSVRKVFAQGYMAKDLRQFVQTFNMSQKDQPPSQVCVGYGIESRYETDVPTNKKPKLSSNEAESDSGDGDGEAYGERGDDSRICPPPMIKATSKWSKYMSEDDDMEQMTRRRAMANAGSKWRDIITEDEDEEQTRHRPTITMEKGVSKQNNCTRDKAKAASKWDHYLTEDDWTQHDMEPTTCREKVAKATSKWDDYMTKDGGAQRTRQPTAKGKIASKWSSYSIDSDFKTITHDQRVEEDDIHPDFI